jgi:hypothetical protein
MKRHQVFSPEDLDLMGKVFFRASDELQGSKKNQLAKAIVMTYRPRATEAALAAAALHLVSLKYID